MQWYEETLIEEDDASNIAETLNRKIDALVIKLAHGDSVPLAKFRLKLPDYEERKHELEIIERLCAIGLKPTRSNSRGNSLFHSLKPIRKPKPHNRKTTRKKMKFEKSIVQILSPYGEWPHKLGMQLVDERSLEKMKRAARFSTLVGCGIPIFIGHPDDLRAQKPFRLEKYRAYSGSATESPWKPNTPTKLLEKSPKASLNLCRRAGGWRSFRTENSGR